MSLMNMMGCGVDPTRTDETDIQVVTTDKHATGTGQMQPVHMQPVQLKHVQS